jgi:hypothetical protein
LLVVALDIGRSNMKREEAVISTSQVRESAPDPLEEQRRNEEAIRSIMDLYNVDRETARGLWNKFIDTVIKIKAVSLAQKGSVNEP